MLTYTSQQQLNSVNYQDLSVLPIVIKRDGSKAQFDAQFILNAMKKAAQAVNIEDDSYFEQLSQEISFEILNGVNQQIDIADIQQRVENHLMQSQYPQVARAYIEYRHDRDKEREKRSRLTQEIEGLIEQNNVLLMNENANKDAKVIPTQRDLLAGIVARHYAKSYLLPKEVVQAHERGEIHYHDLDYSPFFPMFNCMLVDLQGMLTNGFKMGNAEIEPPKSITTATAV